MHVIEQLFVPFRDSIRDIDNADPLRRDRMAGVSVRTSTRTSYEGHIRNHIEPAIGNTRLQDLTKSQIKRM